MKDQVRAALAAIVVISVAAINAHAQAHVQSASTVQARNAVLNRVEQLDAEVASLRSQLMEESDYKDFDSAGCESYDCETLDCDFCIPTWEFWADLTLLRFHKTGGVQTGSDAFTDTNPEAAELGYSLSPRFHLRRYFDNGMFAEVTYFEFNHAATNNAGDGSIRVRSYTLDGHIGEQFELNSCWSLECMAGIRYLDYSEQLNDDIDDVNLDGSRGIGGILTLALTRQLCGPWSLFGGTRAGIVYGDHRIMENRGLETNVRLTDESFVQLEAYVGVEYTRTLPNGAELYVRGSGEWISYGNVTSQFNFTAPGLAGHELAVQPGADASFGGFSATLGLRW